MPLRPAVSNSNFRFVLQIEGTQDEYGMGEYVFGFKAVLATLEENVDVCSIKGLLIDHERGDICIRIRTGHDGKARSGCLDIYKGAVAQDASARRTEVRVRVQGESTLFLYDPEVIDIEESKLPGTRLIASSRKHFTGRNLGIVLDLETPDGDPSFRDYFFSGLDILDLRFLDHRLALGRWGRTGGPEAGTYTFTAINE